MSHFMISAAEALLPQRELEREVVRVHPKEAVRERIKPLTVNLSELRCSISSPHFSPDFVLAEVLSAACIAYLEKHDPVLKAKRNLGKPAPAGKSVLRQIPAHVKHQVITRDDGHCAYRDAVGKRCPNRRWVELHHQLPFSHGGKHTAGKYHYPVLAPPQVSTFEPYGTQPIIPLLINVRRSP